MGGFPPGDAQVQVTVAFRCDGEQREEIDLARAECLLGILHVNPLEGDARPRGGLLDNLHCKACLIAGLIGGDVGIKFGVPHAQAGGGMGARRECQANGGGDAIAPYELLVSLRQSGLLPKTLSVFFLGGRWLRYRMRLSARRGDEAPRRGCRRRGTRGECKRGFSHRADPRVSSAWFQAVHSGLLKVVRQKSAPAFTKSLAECIRESLNTLYQDCADQYVRVENHHFRCGPSAGHGVLP